MSENKEKTMIDNEAKDNKFWVIVGTKMLLFTDKEAATVKMQEILAETPETTLAEISYDMKERKFDVDPVPWKEISLKISEASERKLAEAKKEIEALKKELESKK